MEELTVFSLAYGKATLRILPGSLKTVRDKEKERAVRSSIFEKKGEEMFCTNGEAGFYRSCRQFMDSSERQTAQVQLSS